MPEEPTQEKVKKTLKYSILDGSFYSSMVGFGESFFTAFAVFLKASNLQIGLLGSLPQTLGSFIQLFSNQLIRLFGSRKKLILTCAMLQALIHIPIALVFFMGTFSVYNLILFISIYFILAMIVGPAWSSWMGDLVNEKERGSYFGRRNKIAGFVSFITFIIAGYLLQNFSDGSTHQYIGFLIIFGIAFASRVVSFYYLTKQHEPAYEIVQKAQFTLIEFIQQSFKRNFNRFVIYLCFMNFAVYISAPFVTAYLLYGLKMDYKTYTIVIAAATLAKLLMMPVWGRIADRYGTKKVLFASGILMPFTPLLFALSPNTYFLIAAQIFSGITWAGFELASFNYIFDATDVQKRVTCISYLNVLNGIAILIGALAGSFIVKYNNLFWSAYILVFIISFALRLLATIIFLPKIEERRNVENTTYPNLMLSLISDATTNGVFHTIMTIPEKTTAIFKNGFKKK